MKILPFLLLLFCQASLRAQQGFTFTRFNTEDNTGISSNVVYSLYQDEKGYIWVGHANGLQRFDGSKFIQFNIDRPGNDPMPYNAITQIIPFDSNVLVLNFGGLRQLGIFNPANFSYKRLAVITKKPIHPRADFVLWKDSKGELFLNLLRYGVLHFDKKQAAFIEDNAFSLPAGFVPAMKGVYDDSLKQQVWFAGDKGICVYDRKSRQTWNRDNNPQQLPILQNETVQDLTTQIFIDRARHFWIFTWPENNSKGQVKYCLDSTGTTYLSKDTAGLLTGPAGYTEYSHFYETPRSGLWIYGKGILFNWDKSNHRFHYTHGGKSTSVNNIDYDNVHQVLEDRDGNIWIATDKGLFFTSYGSGTYSVINYLFDDSKTIKNITDIIEMPGGVFWFASWGQGVFAMDSAMNEKEIPFYQSAPPADWPAPYRGAIRLAWTLFHQPSTGDVWMGCNGGVIVIYNPQKRTTRYLFPPEANKSTIRYIIEDKRGYLWIGTQGGRLLRWDGHQFIVVQDIGTIIYKILVDKEGLLWLATQEKGLYCVNPRTGSVLKHFTADGSANSLYSNTGYDIEQLNDSTIVYGAGALNFINKRTGRVRLSRYEDGLPSNSVHRLRMDAEGFLWMITANGLSRYNPYNKQVNTYGRKDGITLAALTTDADFYSSNNYIMFGGGNAVMLFKPSLFANTHAPPNVIITDFKIFNQYMPVDSLMQVTKIKLEPNQNSFSIYFSALSFQQRDRLTYYFKMEGIDKEWLRADGNNSLNYSLLPPGDYTFKVYAENVEGIRSAHTTQLHIVIQHPFWRTKWFTSVLVFLVLLVIYYFHNERVNRLLAVEKVRNRVARDLHDDMGSTLSTINILSAMAKSKMNTDAVKTAGYLSKISDNSQRMMEAMDDIVWSIKPSNDSMQRVTARMREFATSVLEAKDITLQFAVAEAVANVKLNMEARRDFFLIFKEAVNNAAKYSKATTVDISITAERRQLSFLVKDNGIGFDVAGADGGNGMGNMKKRADAIHGRIKISSRDGGGTRVKLTIPTRF